jgi:hypothetical protein
MIFFVGGGGEHRKEVAIFGQAIKFDHSARSPTSLTLQSNGNDVGNGNGRDGYNNKGGGRAMVTMAMVTATSWAMATATRVASN